MADAEDNSPDVRAKIALDYLWSRLLQELFRKPTVPVNCPSCGKTAVTASWRIYDRAGRGASADIACASCGEHAHFAAILPANVIDAYPPGRNAQDDTVETIYRTGSTRGWWKLEEGTE